MADTEITLLFNAHRYEALERILTESGSSVENEYRTTGNIQRGGDRKRNQIGYRDRK